MSIPSASNERGDVGVKDYCVVDGYYVESLEKAVREKIAEGWEPTGGVFALPFRTGNPWHQAMVKR